MDDSKFINWIIEKIDDAEKMEKIYERERERLIYDGKIRILNEMFDAYHRGEFED